MSRDARAELIRYLTEAHAMERLSLELLDRAASALPDERLRTLLAAHRELTRGHEQRIAALLGSYGAHPSALADAGLGAAGRTMALAAQLATDTVIRVATETYAFESLEIAAYGIICRFALQAGEQGTANVLAEIIEEEEAMAEQLAGELDHVVELALAR